MNIKDIDKKISTRQAFQQIERLKKEMSIIHYRIAYHSKLNNLGICRPICDAINLMSKVEWKLFRHMMNYASSIPEERP